MTSIIKRSILMIRSVLIGFLLLCSSVSDMLTMEIPDIYFIVISLQSTRFSLENLSGFLVISLIYAAILTFSFLLDKPVPIGMGDAKILASLAFSKGIGCAAYSFAYSSMLSGIYALFLVITRKAKKQDCFAYMPFIFAGYIIYMLIYMLPFQNI